MTSCMKTLGTLVAALTTTIATSAVADEKELSPVTYGTSWFAQAEHGGFYQAKALGLYEKHGLDVTLKMGGPQVNGAQLLASGKIDFNMGYSLNTLQAVEQGLPIVTVAACAQKDPQALMSHKGVGHDSLEDLKGEPIKVAAAGRNSYWPWLRETFGYTDDQLRTYNYSFGPFAVDEQAIQQGYATSDGYFLEKEGIDGQALLLADRGWKAYSTTIDTTPEMIKEHPEIVRAFVAATAEGWRKFFENPEPAMKLIKEANKEQNRELMLYAKNNLDTMGITFSGDAADGSACTMTDQRWKDFFNDMVATNVLPADLEYKNAYTLEFVDATRPDQEVSNQ